jgi:hypothetical protein
MTKERGKIKKISPLDIKEKQATESVHWIVDSLSGAYGLAPIPSCRKWASLRNVNGGF